MEALELVRGEGERPRRQGRHSPLAARLTATMASALVDASTRTLLGERVGDVRIRARLNVLAAFSRAAASRIRARLVALGPGPLPLPSEEVSSDEDVVLALRVASMRATAASSRDESTAELARQLGDLSTAWVCDLNRTEAQDAARELAKMADNLEGR